jgi:hypothetical protein
MKNGQDSDFATLDAVWEKVGSTGDDEFACSSMTAGTTETWIANELVGGSYDATGNVAGSLGLVLFDVGADF